MTEEAYPSDLVSSKSCPSMIQPDKAGNVDPATNLAVGNYLTVKEEGHDLEELAHGNSSNWSAYKLVTALKDAFHSKDFAKVEAILVAREEQSKMQIKKLEEERLKQMSLENELRKCKRECDELRNMMSKLQEENKVLREREKLAEERCNNLLEKVKSMGEKEHEIIDLRSKNYELEFAKEKAEGELELVRKRFEGLEKRVLNLENDLPLLRMDLKRDEVRVVNRNPDNGRANEPLNVEEITLAPSCDSPVNANGRLPNAGSERPTCQTIAEIVDFDSDEDSAHAENMSAKRMTDPAEKSHSDRTRVANGDQTLKRKRTLSIDVGESESGDNNDNTLNGKSKMKTIQEPVCGPDDCPLNHCSTKTISSDRNEVSRGCETPRENSMVSRQCEQQTGSEHKSQNLVNGFPLDGLNFSEESEESSCSSESDSDDENDGVCISPSAILSLHQNLETAESSHRK